MAWSKEAVEAAVSKVGARAATDLEYRSLCVNNIHEAIQQETGIEVPKSFKIGVLDQSANTMSIILPPVQTVENELTEGELESVAGGSKDGANDFFDGMAQGLSFTAGADHNGHKDNAEGTSGNIIGQVLGAPLVIFR